MTISILSCDNSVFIQAKNDYGSCDASIGYSPYNYQNPIKVFGDINKFAKLEELVKVFDPNFSENNSGIIPPGLLYVTKNFLVFEKPPVYKHISLIPKLVDSIEYDSDEPLSYIIPIPWQLYIVEYSSDFYTSKVRMHFMKDSLREASQELYMAPLPNLYTSGELCRPFFSDMEDIERYSKDIAGVIASAYDWIWGSGTNLDLTDTVVKYYSLFDQNPENTILSKLSHHGPHIPKETFYCTDRQVIAFFEAWEKFDIYEVSNLEWPKNSKNLRFSEDFQEGRSRLQEYLEATRVTNEVVSTSQSSDDCSCYEDDDDEYHYEDCECECHMEEDEDRYDINDLYKYFGIWPPKGVTYIESLTNCIRNSESNPIKWNFRRTNIISNIEDSIILP